MKRIIAVLPALAILSACGTADGELTAGNWKNTMTMTKFEIPGAPAAMAKQAQSVLNKPQSTEACMTPAMAMEGNYTTEKVEMSLSGEVSDSKIPGGKANIGMTITSERIGDCKS